MLGILQWHFVRAPVWIVKFIWTIEQVLTRYFSVPLMVRTWVTHWHKDAVGYDSGTMSQIVVAFAWNMISRAIGFCVRSFVLVAWVLAATIAALLGIGALLLFLVWPLLALLAFVFGLIT